MLPVVNKAEAYFDSLFDLWAAQQAHSAVQQNRTLAASVERAHEALRLSSPELSTVRPLEPAGGGLALREGTSALGLPGFGSPRFWSPGKWILVVVQVLLVAAVIGWALLTRLGRLVL